MYISIKLPPVFGSFNRLRKENYPFNTLFTKYLAAVSRLGLSLSMDVDSLVGYIEDRIFDGMRLPDVPEGDEPVNLRYKTENPDVVEYIGGSSLTNRMAVMYIARMTLRLSVTYGTSLLRLTRLIEDLGQEEPKKQVKRAEQQKKETPKKEVKPKPAEPEEEPAEEPAPLPKVRLSGKAQETPVKAKEPVTPVTNKSAEAAKAALSELQNLTEQALTEEPEDTGASSDENVVETNPFLTQFM